MRKSDGQSVRETVSHNDAESVQYGFVEDFRFSFYYINQSKVFAVKDEQVDPEILQHHIRYASRRKKHTAHAQSYPMKERASSILDSRYMYTHNNI